MTKFGAALELAAVLARVSHSPGTLRGTKRVGDRSTMSATPAWEADPLSRPRCPQCGYRVRGPLHKEGAAHLGTVHRRSR